MHNETEKAFQDTTSVVLGKKLAGLVDYEEWLKENVRELFEQKSVLSDSKVVMPTFSYYLAARERCMTYDEYLEAGKKSISEQDARELDLSNAVGKLRLISYYTPDQHLGSNMNMEECGLYYASMNCFRSYAMNRSKYCAYCFWPRQSDHVFGCSFIFSSAFCLKCYHSINLTRCFEVSNSSNCTDCFFSHNCENMSDCMFCFNAKNLRHAIGNKEYSKEEYDQVKKKIIGEILNTLEKRKKLEKNVYNIGCRKG